MTAIFSDGILKCIFLNENDIISIKILLKLVLWVPIDNNPAFVQVMAWYRTGDQAITWVKDDQFTDAYMRS